MDPIRIGHSLRALRLRRRWRQVDLAAAVRTSSSTISRIERGRIGGVSMATMRRVCEGLGASLDVRVRWNGESLDRLLDEAHAGLVETLVRELRAAGWSTAVEVSFAVRGERGSIDVLAFHESTATLLVAEVKSVVPDAQATLAGIDRKARLARAIGPDRGWHGRHVARLLVIGDSTTSRRRIERLGATFRAAFPIGSRAVRAWIQAPSESIAGLLFLPYARDVHGSLSVTGRQRVRRARPQPPLPPTVAL
jgi:transcriptional regulator with XRE-family HTH domain